MIEAYKIAANLSITGDAQKKMAELAKAATKLAAQFENINRRLPVFVRHLEQFERVSSKLTPLINGMALSLKAAADTMPSLNEGFAKFNSRSLSTERRLERISNRAEAARVRLQMLGETALTSRAGIVPSVRIGAAGAVGARAAGAGAVGAIAAAGYAGIGLASSGFKARLSMQAERMQLVGQNIPGLGEADINPFLKQSKIPYISDASMLTALVDAATITKSAPEAKGIAPFLAKAAYATSMIGGQEHKISKSEFRDMMKFSEIASGSKEQKVLQPYMEDMFKAMLASGFRVKPSTYLAVANSARGQLKGMDPNYLFFMLDPLIQEYGKRTGPMIAQFSAHLKSGRLTAGAYKIMSSLGLIDPSKVQTMSGQKILAPGAVKGLSGRNDFQYVTEVLKPALEKAGFKTPEAQQGVLGKIFTNSDLTMVLTFLQQFDKFTSMFAANLKTSGLDQMITKGNSQDIGKLSAYQEALLDFKTAIGDLVSPSEIIGLNMVTSILKGMAETLPSIPNGIGKFLFELFHPYKAMAVDSATNSVDATSPASKGGANSQPIVLVTNQGVLAKSVTNAQNKQLSRSVYAMNGQSAVSSVLHPFAQGTNNTGVQSQ